MLYSNQQKITVQSQGLQYGHQEIIHNTHVKCFQTTLKLLKTSLQGAETYLPLDIHFLLSHNLNKHTTLQK